MNFSDQFSVPGSNSTPIDFALSLLTQNGAWTTPAAPHGSSGESTFSSINWSEATLSALREYQDALIDAELLPFDVAAMLNLLSE